MPDQHLKHRFINLTEVAFWAGQGEENDFKVQWKTLNIVVSDSPNAIWHLKVIFCLLTSPKCNLSEVEKAMYQGLAWHFELIFGLLTLPNGE